MLSGPTKGTGVLARSLEPYGARPAVISSPHDTEQHELRIQGNPRISNVTAPTSLRDSSAHLLWSIHQIYSRQSRTDIAVYDSYTTIHLTCKPLEFSSPVHSQYYQQVSLFMWDGAEIATRLDPFGVFS